MTQERFIQLLSAKNEIEDYVLQSDPHKYLADIGQALKKEPNENVRDDVESTLNGIGNPEGIKVFTKDIYDRTFVRIIYPTIRESNELFGLEEEGPIPLEDGESFGLTPTLRFLSYKS